MLFAFARASVSFLYLTSQVGAHKQESDMFAVVQRGAQMGLIMADL